MSDAVTRLEESTERLERPVYAWATIESVEPIYNDEANGEDSPRPRWFAVSMDAMVTDREDRLEDLSPDEPTCIRRVIAFAPGESAQFLHDRKFFERSGTWWRLTIMPGQLHGDPVVLEGPFAHLTSNDRGGQPAIPPLAMGTLVRAERLPGEVSVRLNMLCTPAHTFLQTSIERADSADSALRVRVFDVGQAHCAALYRHDDAIGYFDVGEPLPFNRASWPTTFGPLTVSGDCFVALSHWDYDHYSMALKSAPNLQAATWMAPKPLHWTPTMKRLATKLGASLSLMSHPRLRIRSGVTLHRCTGPKDSRNDSGYAMRINCGDGVILLPGDAEYSCVPASAKTGVSALLVSHHGGPTKSPPPAPPPGTGSSMAVVSFGYPNSYRHPASSCIAAHAAMGWKTVATNWTGTTSLGPALAPVGTTRGDHWLKP